MEDDTKELIKKDIFFIAKLCGTHDCSKPETAKKIYNFIIEKSILKSPIGKLFQQRMVSVAKGENNEDLCLLCRKNIASNHAICPECLNKITKFQAKRTINPTMAKKTNIENSTVDKKNTLEIGKQAKAFTQNVGSTAQEISGNVKNVANAAQKKILNEMKSESAQEIKRKAIAQAGDASNSIKKVANSAKAKWNNMTPKKRKSTLIIGVIMLILLIAGVNSNMDLGNKGKTISAGNQDEAANVVYSLYDKDEYNIKFENITYPCSGMYDGEVGKWIGDSWVGDDIKSYVFSIQSISTPQDYGIIWISKDGRAIGYGPIWGNDGSRMYRLK